MDSSEPPSEISLKRYHDDFVSHEMIERFQHYIISYARRPHDIEAHFFRNDNDRILVYVMKWSSIPVPEALLIIEAAIKQFELDYPSMGHLTSTVNIVWDGKSLADE